MGDGKPRAIPGKTFAVELDMIHRQIVRRACARSLATIQRCQHCGRPAKEEDRKDVAHETALIAALEKAIDYPMVAEFFESLSYDHAEKLHEYGAGMEAAQQAKRLVHAVRDAGGMPVFKFYVDADGKRVMRPRMTEEDQRGVGVLKAHGNHQVVLTGGLHRYIAASLARADIWDADEAKYAAEINEKFGVGGLTPEEAYPRECFAEAGAGKE